MNILRERMLTEIEEYFRNRGKFERGAEYFGMAGPQKPEILIDYIKRLQPEERRELIRLVVEIAIADKPLISVPGAVPSAVQALYHLCVNGFLEQSNDSVILLENMFTNPINVGTWVHAGEMVEEQGGSRFKETWHYAAAFSFILMNLESKKAKNTWRYLIDHAHSQEFKETLKRQPEAIDLLKSHLKHDV